MNITASMVNELRQKSGAGMMDCKKALTEAEGNIEKAIEILRKKGAAVAAKRAERSANEGLVITKISDDSTRGTIIELNCETDFVARSEDFVKIANDISSKAFNSKSNSVSELTEKHPELEAELTEVIGKVGEKVNLSRLAYVELTNGYLIDYIHPGSKLGVLVSFENAAAKNGFETIAKDIAMQVAAMKPISVYREEVDNSVIEKEIEIYKELARKEGKPEKILETIAQGKLTKFFQDNCLFEQAYIKDNSKSVGQLVKDFNSANKSEVKIKSFYRFHLGDEKK